MGESITIVLATIADFYDLMGETSIQMFLQFFIVVLVLPFAIAASENAKNNSFPIARENSTSGVPIVVVSQYQLKEDIRHEVTTALRETTTIITNCINEVTRNVTTTTVADAIEPLRRQIISEVHSNVELLLKPLLDEVERLQMPGKTSINPATSCEEVKAHDPTIPSGYYWIQTSSHPLVQVYCEMTKIELLIGKYRSYPASSCEEIYHASHRVCPSGYYWIKTNESSFRVYCDMTLTCGGIIGGWMRVANLDMNDTDHECLQGLTENNQQSVRSCTKSIYSSGCSSATIDVYGVEYSRVCGKIIGYQFGSPDSFYRYYSQQVSIDSYYVDGVSLTHGANPRNHIWTFAAATDEESRTSGQCPCVNRLNYRTRRIPPWVGNDYFCDTGSRWTASSIFYPDDPLWDGEGCGAYNNCCSFNRPPWFFKQLNATTTDNIDLRICTDSSRIYEGIFIQTVELYVQ